ncbi:MAG: ASCH domain-containing protein, partial [candidate division Zixibacteria bacterium]|nr:ASCH domain-containing protein [candidate division Zixibacteria bacterium]
ATCGLVWAYEAENEKLPSVGDLSIITNWEGEPLCIIESIEVEINVFNEVDEKFAYEEGEGDRSLAYWRKVHWDYFSRECSNIGREPTETMPLMCERFRVVFVT